MDQLVALLSGAALGAAVSGVFGLLQANRRHAHERQLREEERRHEAASERQASMKIVYRTVAAHMRATHSAIHRSADAIYHYQHGMPYPYASKGSVDWAIDEIDQLRSVQPDVDILGSREVRSTLDELVQIAEALRYSLGSPDDWEEKWADQRIGEFDRHFDGILERIRAELLVD